ncbi:protein arv1 [Moniliophthora roreri MCA 2997]|uniref:Protein ARV n=2 Tax=Moniliophthora roreri TaxID=221103 RepID=V2XTS3_MONRO|nr:protein arv1 [Moniliophthora roreri MCA 2997]KAI3616005.1 protein arv1 [Moniliophthora roreri]
MNPVDPILALIQRPPVFNLNVLEMPICTTCTHWTPYLYTVYQSAYNMRLEQCSQCHAFADPYVEHDTLTLLIDLILLKRGVYRHLLYNRGAKPRRAVEKERSNDKDSTRRGADSRRNRVWNEVEMSRWALVLRLGFMLVFVDAFIRWSYLNSGHSPTLSPWSLDTIDSFAKTFVGCLAETVAFHAGILVSCYLLKKGLNMYQSLIKPWRQLGRKGASSETDIKREFRYSLVPLALFYSSLTKLFLLFLLTIWRPSKSPSGSTTLIQQPLPWNDSGWSTLDKVSDLLEFLNDDKLDKEWIVRNVLGGMSAGFGLRVILDSHPAFTTVIILIGWATKTAMARLVGSWVGGNQKAEQWMAYSIP